MVGVVFMLEIAPQLKLLYSKIFRILSSSTKSNLTLFDPILQPR